jgi:hypothetical protein
LPHRRAVAIVNFTSGAAGERFPSQHIRTSRRDLLARKDHVERVQVVAVGVGPAIDIVGSHSSAKGVIAGVPAEGVVAVAAIAAIERIAVRASGNCVAERAAKNVVTSTRTIDTDID